MFKFLRNLIGGFNKKRNLASKTSGFTSYIDEGSNFSRESSFEFPSFTGPQVISGQEESAYDVLPASSRPPLAQALKETHEFGTQTDPLTPIASLSPSAPSTFSSPPPPPPPPPPPALFQMADPLQALKEQRAKNGKNNPIRSKEEEVKEALVDELKKKLIERCAVVNRESEN